MEILLLFLLIIICVFIYKYRKHTQDNDSEYNDSEYNDNDYEYDYNIVEPFEVDGYNSLAKPRTNNIIPPLQNQDDIIKAVINQSLGIFGSVDEAVEHVSFPRVYVSTNYSMLSPLQMQNESSVKIAIQRFFNSSFNSRSLTTDLRLTPNVLSFVVANIENIRFLDLNGKTGSISNPTERYFMFDASIACSDSTNVNVFTKTFTFIIKIVDYFKYFSGKDNLSMTSEPPLDNIEIINVSLNNKSTQTVLRQPEPLNVPSNNLYYIKNSLGLLDPFTTSTNVPYKPLTRNPISPLKETTRNVENKL